MTPYCEPQVPSARFGTHGLENAGTILPADVLERVGAKYGTHNLRFAVPGGLSC